MRAGKITLLIVFIVSYSSMGFALDYTINKDIIKEIVLTHRYIDGPTHGEMLHSYSKRSGIPMNEICKVLMEFLEQGCKTDKYAEKKYSEKILCEYSVDVLNELEFKEAVPLLTEISSTDDEMLRGATIMAISEIADIEELIDFIDKKRKYQRSYSESDMHYINKSLARKIILDKKMKPENKSAVLNYFKNTVGKNPGNLNVLLLDSVLKKEDKEYSVSFEREIILKKIDYTNFPEIAQKDIKSRLEEIRNTPLEKRTWIGIDVTESKADK